METDSYNPLLIQRNNQYLFTTTCQQCDPAHWIWISSLVDSLLIDATSGFLANSGFLGGLLGRSGVLSGLLESDGIVGDLLESEGVVDNVVSGVGDLLDDILDGDVDISLCVGLDLLPNILFYHFKSGNNKSTWFGTDSLSDMVLNVFCL